MLIYKVLHLLIASTQNTCPATSFCRRARRVWEDCIKTHNCKGARNFFIGLLVSQCRHQTFGLQTLATCLRDCWLCIWYMPWRSCKIAQTRSRVAYKLEKSIRKSLVMYPKSAQCLLECELRASASLQYKWIIIFEVSFACCLATAICWEFTVYCCDLDFLPAVILSCRCHNSEGGPEPPLEPGHLSFGRLYWSYAAHNHPKMSVTVRSPSCLIAPLSHHDGVMG